MFNDLFPIAWNDFHFLRPKFLWLLAPVVVLTALSLIAMGQDMKWVKIIAPNLRPYVISKGSNTAKIVMHIALSLGFALAIVGLAGPTWKKIEDPAKKLETPMIVILDLSPSMLSEDIQPNRLERAKFKIKDLIKHDPKARMALVAFSGTAHLVVPLTRDYSIIENSIETISPKTMPFPGSDLNAALVLCDTITQTTRAPGTLLLLTDDIYERERTLLANYRQHSKNKVIVLPINTPTGALMPDGSRSQLNTDVLTGLGEIDSLEVQRLTLDDSDVALIADEIGEHLIYTDKSDEKQDDWRDAGLLCVLPAALILLLWFRRGWVLYGFAGICLLTSCGQGSRANDFWFTKDYQGQRLSDQGNYAEAAETYTNEMRKGIAYYKAGDFEAAIQAFSKDTTANGAYNLGLAYYRNGDYGAARSAFDSAVEKDPGLEAARTNRDAVEALIPKSDGMSVGNAEEAPEDSNAKNIQNYGEDLSGGGQEATEKDLKKQRQEETAQSEKHLGKELDEVPEEIDISIQRNADILMRKVDDDPSLFLQRKFRYQARKYHMKPASDVEKW